MLTTKNCNVNKYPFSRLIKIKLNTVFVFLFLRGEVVCVLAGEMCLQLPRGREPLLTQWTRVLLNRLK